jgi:probable rRNA maturation factor
VAIEVVNKQRLASIDRGRVAELAGTTLAAIGRAGASVTIAFVRDAAIRRLNLSYRGKDRATDVLSFPTGDEADEPAGSLRERDFLGDVVISADTAAGQASEAGHSFEREVSELVIHGILHLCGYDHETDEGEMNRLELRLRRKLLGGVGNQG